MKIYKREDIFNETLKYFNGDELATDVWINKYALKDVDGNLYEMSPDDMHKRLSKEFGRIENNYINPISEKDIYDLIKNFKYIIPQGSPMSGIGNNFQISSLSNCFVIGNEHDSYGAILKTDEELIQLCKRRGGVGTDLSHIRPRNSRVNNAALTSTGIVPFMERYSNSIREVAQSGRRGALMESISIKHPDSENFIDAKMTDGKVTGANISVKISDEFMNAVINKESFIQQYPIESESPLFKNEIDSEKLWNKIIHNAWKSAEPGVLFWDTIIRESVADCYSDLGFKTISTNPCIVGDTIIATADGRNGISIKQLADEGKDVPVYSLDNNGKLCIKTMRNPRITGYNQKIYKLTLENGHTIRITGNHKFRLKNSNYVEVKNLKIGDNLHILTKYKASLEEIFLKSNSRSSDYYWLNNGNLTSKSEHRFIYEQLESKIDNGYVIHHKDFNSLNNSIDNLQLMSKEEHDKFHSFDMLGEKNPYHKMSDEWKFNFSSHPGEKNPKYSNITNEEIKNHAIILTKKLNKRFSRKDWIEYAKENNLIQQFSKFRQDDKSVVTLAKQVALELGLEYIDTDPRTVDTYRKMLQNGYDSKIEDNRVFVKKICETCGEEFWIEHRRREVSFCGSSCANIYVNTSKDINQKRTDSINNTYLLKSVENKQKQLEIFTKLRFNLGKNPLLKEWEEECRNNNVAFRLKTKNGFNNYSELVKESEFFNHRIVSIEEDGFEDVYNGTVDEFHNFFSGEFLEKTKSNKDKYLYINQLQCGEIPLCDADSCRLLALNLYSYVELPFTKDAYFNYDLFKKHVIIAQRMMDDILDLELEKLDKIIEKIKSDTEPDYIKSTELNLWYRIKQKAIQGRRTGLGITAEGDMLAAMGFIYGTTEATEFSVNIHKTLAIEAYRSSAIMAKERGKFELYDYDREKNNPFIKRLIENDSDLDNLLKQNGRRNISLLTVAPTGTVSVCAQTTSGIEPAFLISYKRRRKINQTDKNFKISFTDDSGDIWEEYNVFHHKFLTWLIANDYDVDDVRSMDDKELQKIIEKSPYYKATSNDIDWVEKVKMQGEIQKWVDHSISVTVNLPKTATEEMVSNIYITAWKCGCKGITIYRDGSRNGVLISNDNKEEKKEIVKEVIKETTAPKRPKSLECEVIRFQNNKEKWIGFVGSLNNKPYEIFTGLYESFQIPSFVEKGHIKRVKDNVDSKSRYDFIYTDKDGYEQELKGLSRAFNREYWNYGKLVSGILRHGMPLPNVISLIDSLNLGVDNIVSWKAGVKRMLKTYMKDEEMKGAICPECLQETLRFESGCAICMNCTYSKCN